MGKFEGYLICADIDGTFRMGDSVSENKKAVQYFMEHGGAFTFATGRSVAHLREEGLLDCMNAPACLCNGGIVYDYEKEKVLREERLPFSLGEFLEEIRKSKSEIQAMILFHSCEEESIVIANAAEAPNQLLSQKMIKIVCVFETAKEADALKERIKEIPFFDDCSVLKSWPVGVEFNSIHATKGDGLEFLKQHLRGIHTTIGVGDYENDLPLLTHADIGAAPENAIDSIKKIAKVFLKSADQCAIKELIERLEKRIEK